MVSGIERPLDLLNESKGKEILIELKDGKQLAGTLLAFDIHINIVIDHAKEIINNELKRSLGLSFIRGNTILWISPASKTEMKK
jgi:small nuclear ribonucleoprotein (snRNP)-like protein